jgi:hypothetical protein
MVFDVGVALTWILFLALFPIAFFWLRRAYRILWKRDFSEVALKRGEPPPDPARFAPYTAALNLIAGGIVLAVIYGVLMARFDYETWTAVAGMTIWCKFFLDFAISRHAHPFSAPSDDKAKEPVISDSQPEKPSLSKEERG